MAIVIKNNKIKKEVTDENGNLITIITYNPEDTKSYTKFSDIIEKIYKIQDKLKKSKPSIKEIPKRELALEELDGYRKSFEVMNDVLHYQEDLTKEIFNDFDCIFGDGTCEKIMDGSYDILLLMPIIEEVKPDFDKSRNKKVNKYLQKENVEVLEVME